MAVDESTEVQRKHLQKLVSIKKQRLAILEERVAAQGVLEADIEKLIEIRELRQDLQKLEIQLRALGVSTGIIPFIPHNIPPRSEFIDREEEKSQILEALTSRSFLISIEGIGGMGKTALAIEAAHECWEQGLFEAVVWTTARDREIVLPDILDTIARVLNYPYITCLSADEKPAETAKLLRAKACLLVIDNFEAVGDKEDVKCFLSKLPEPSKALLTSRYFTLSEARTITLKGLRDKDALTLIRSEGNRLGLKSVEGADDETLLPLCEATGGSPYALKLAIGQVRALWLDAVLESLQTAEGDLFSFIFESSWKLLSKDARHILMAMPVFATAVPKEIIEAVSDLHGSELTQGLRQLVDMALLEVGAGLTEQERRYGVHPLTRAFAAKRLAERPQLEKVMYSRSAEYFLSFSKRHGFKNWPAHKALTEQIENVLASVDWCHKGGRWQQIIGFADALLDFLGVQGYWEERLKIGQHMLEAARSVGDRQAEAKALIDVLGWIYLRRKDTESARKLVEEGLGVAERGGQTYWQAVAEGFLARLAMYEGGLDKAAQLLQQALSHAQTLPASSENDVLVPRFYSDLGVLAAARQDIEASEAWHCRALESRRRIEDLEGIAITLVHLADVALQRGRYEEADRFYQEALTTANEMERKITIAHAKLGLAKLREAQGDYTHSRQLAQEALDIIMRLGMEEERKEVETLMTRLKTFEILPGE